MKYYRISLGIIMILTIISTTSCTEDYGPEIDKIKEDISQLQSSVDKLQEAYEGGKIIKGVEALSAEEGDGWKINFSDNSSIKLQNGKDGKDGIDGANGKDGINGINGEDGKDGITPYLKIDADFYWTISYDNGNSYNQIVDATGSPVSAIGKDGEIGVSVSIRENKDGYYEIIHYKEDINTPISITPTIYSTNPNNQISSIVEDSQLGITTITMNSGKIYTFLNEIKNVSTTGCVLMSFGDSITTESYYIKLLRQLLQVSNYYNLAVVGAWWADKTGTLYDGNPLWEKEGANLNNVIGNQIQKVINNPDKYPLIPDIIIIAAGTNDYNNMKVSNNASINEIRTAIDANYQNENGIIPLTDATFDENDTYKNYRKTIGGAMRYCVTKLQQLYPNAKIYILTPIQACYATKNYVESIATKQDYISESARHLGVPVIHVGEECGINADFEYGGAMWTGPTGSHERSGRDLIDGLHPNTNGSKKMAKYIANFIINNY